MKTSSRQIRRAGSARGWRRISLTLLAAALAFCLSLGVLLAQATGALDLLPGAPLQAQIARAQANATGRPGDSNAPALTPTNQPPTATPPPATPTLSILSPTSKEGPVGAHISLSGSHWGASATVTIVALSSGPCQVAASGQTLTSTQANGSGAINTSFLWPSSLGSVGTTYIICASNGAAAATGIPYTVLSSAPPTISLSLSSVQVGGVVSVSGSNFTGASKVTLSAETTSNAIQKIRTVGVSGDGSFLTQFTPTASQVGALIIMAATPAQNGATPALQATAQLTVQGATTPTVTTTVSPTATTAAGGSGNGQNTNASGPSLGVIIVLVVAILLVLLLIIGLIVLVSMRRRGGTGPQGPDGAYGDYGPYSGQGAYGGYGGATGRTPTPGYGATGRQNAYGATGRYGAMGQQGPVNPYGPGGVYNNQGLQADPYAPTMQNYASPAIGGVAQWDDAEADLEPDPNWQPRPMSGRRSPHDFDDDTGADAFAHSDLAPGFGPPANPNATPDDPWGDASGGFVPGARRPNANTPGAAGSEPPIYGGMPPRNSDRYNVANSQGSTKPTGQTRRTPPSLYPPRSPQGGTSGGPGQPGSSQRENPDGWGDDGW